MRSGVYFLKSFADAWSPSARSATTPKNVGTCASLQLHMELLLAAGIRGVGMISRWTAV